MAIPESFLDDLVNRSDIMEVVSGYVRLTKPSGANMFGLCPFHGEKTPSFAVNPERQMYKCFGCGKGGGVINFIMEIENVPYRDAVEILARRAGLTVPESGASDDYAEKRRRMLDMNRDAARHFYKLLSSPIGGAARDYLVMRGISKEIVTRFGIGVAPDSWTLLLDAMLKKGYTSQELLEAGLVRRKGGSGNDGGGRGSGGKDGSGNESSGKDSVGNEGGGKDSGGNEGGGKESSWKESRGTYDVFRNRLMFPVIDVRGGVIGFSGRILGDGEPKYLNSPETLVFNKSRNLFALNIAKKSKAGMLILAEGNIDVVSLHQAGFDCAVASLGTSLTAEQVKLMSHYTEKAVIAFDSDEAGKRAALRAIPLLEKTGMSVKVVDMGASKDPDEFLKKHGSDSFKTLIGRSDNHIAYRLQTIKNDCDLSSDEGRLFYLNAATMLLSELGSKPEREIYSARVAETAGISPGSVLAEVDRKLKVKTAKQRKDFEKKVTRPTAAALGADRAQREKNVYSAVAEEGVVRCLVLDPMLMRTASELGFSAEEFTSPFLAKVYGMLQRRISEARDVKEAFILSELDPGEASRLTGILDKPEALPNSERTIRDYIEKIRAEKFKAGVPDTDLLLEIKKYREKKDIGGI